MFHRFHTGTWQRRPSGRVPTRFIAVRVARATVTMAVLRICALLLLFDCQEAFHCCLVVACINRINMISIECHRSGERCPGKREFDNRIEINRVRSGEIMWLFPLRSRQSGNTYRQVALIPYGPHSGSTNLPPSDCGPDKLPGCPYILSSPGAYKAGPAPPGGGAGYFPPPLQNSD